MERGRRHDEPPSRENAPIPEVFLKEEGVSDEQIPPRDSYEEQFIKMGATPLGFRILHQSLY